MSKRELVILANKAKRILEIDKNMRRKYFNKKPHVFSISKVDLVEQIFSQLKIDPNTSVSEQDLKKINDAVSKYVETIRGVFKFSTPSNFTYTVTDFPGGFKVLVVSTDGSDVYEKIYRIRSRGQKPLKDLIDTIKETFAANKKTLNKIGHLADIGHIENYSIAEKTVQVALSRFGQSPPDDLTAKELASISPIYNIILKSEVLKSGTYSKNFTMYVTEEASTLNTAKGRTVEKNLLADARAAVKDFLKNNVDWYNQGGSNSIKELISLELMATAKKYKPKSIKTNTKLQNNSRKEATVSIKSKAEKPTKSSIKVPSGGGSQIMDKKASSIANWSSLINIINRKLPEQVARNMGAPGLVYRTGRFANSTKIVNIEATKDGYPSIVFDYQRNPYDVFDRTKGTSPWNTPARDPRALVDKSVREIVQDMAIGRFYTRRA